MAFFGEILDFYAYEHPKVSFINPIYYALKSDFKSLEWNNEKKHIKHTKLVIKKQNC